MDAEYPDPSRCQGISLLLAASPQVVGPSDNRRGHCPVVPHSGPAEHVGQDGRVLRPDLPQVAVMIDKASQGVLADTFDLAER